MAFFVGSTTALTGNSTWTSPAKYRDRHDTVAGIIASDVAGVLHVEQSTDGTNWDFDTTVTVVGGTGKEFSVTLYAPVWRLRYVNGGTNQASFRIGANTQAGGDS